ncbi:MAG: hypothetical protein EYC70_16475 [Planctomycetota bacterium]|nr:MAG: hypothetical protein EYC70_16475 [Planctomycetota bacterium]
MTQASLLTPALCAGIGLALASAPAAAQCQGHTRNGAAHDWFGWSAANAGDVDADGYADFIAGAPQSALYGSAAAGYAVVVSGRRGLELHRLTGTIPGGAFGEAVAGAGDVNADGFADLIVGAPRTSTGGEATVFSGADAAPLHHITGSAGGYTGASVAGAGDLDRDGFDDFLVGSPAEFGPFGYGGAVRAYSGRDGTLLWETGSPGYRDYFGSSLDGLGDVNGDGWPDVIVGASGTNLPVVNAGAAYVLSGRDATTLYTLRGYELDDLLGTAVTGAGDINQDGLADFAVAAPQAFGVGAVQVYSGQTGQTMLFLHSPATRLARAGDHDGDGRPDLIAGNPAAEAGFPFAGSAVVYSGWTGAVLRSFQGSSAQMWLGCAVAGLGDLDGDGSSELLVGAYGDDRAGPEAGSVTVYSCDDFVLSGPFPGLAGAGNTLIVNGATPFQPVVFAFGTQLGSTGVPGCGILSLNIRPVQRAQVVDADASGTAALPFFVPASKSGTAALFQVAELGACRVSNLVAHVFP